MGNSKTLLVLIGVVALCSASLADSGYQAELNGLGGNAKVHDIISCREYCEIFKISHVSFGEKITYHVDESSVVWDGEAQHMLTQMIGAAARRLHHPDRPAIPDHILRFHKDNKHVDVFLSTTDGNIRVIYQDKILANLGEVADGERYKYWIEFTFNKGGNP
jgi:hypothetical protein